MLHAGLDLSRHRLDVRRLTQDGRTVAETAVVPDGPSLRHFAALIQDHGDVVDTSESCQP